MLASALLRALERVLSTELPQPAEAHYDEEGDTLFVRVREPVGVELGEPAPTRSIIIVFTDEAGELTAVEVVGVKDAVEELCHQRRLC